MSIRFEPDGHVVLITIDRPGARNALDPEHNAALGAAVERFEADEQLRVAVLTGAGDVAFSAGADLKTLIPAHRDAVRAGGSPPWNFGGFTAREVSKPMIAAINGHALAGGLEMALACDIRLAAPNATLGLAETRWAIIPGAGGTQLLTRAVGKALAMDVILSGRRLSAREALQAGLVARVVAKEAWLEEAKRVAREIAEKGPVATRLAKESVNRAYETTLTAGLEAERRALYLAFASEDAHEGLTAFTEKRKPEFKGR